MSATTLKTSRTPQHDAAHTITSPLPPSDGVKTNKVQMTMEEWKRVHRDFKGSHVGPDGKRIRTVLQLGGLVRVEIIK
ncbi:hypothetical protein [Thiomonas intermedia]|uniref:hypothetical protein n=1 Tax=Thiomonas intermedia TaxID=926 RepID=UPI0009A4F8E1|nr:hypothetical protein [Thiomonas intermedia]